MPNFRLFFLQRISEDITTISHFRTYIVIFKKTDSLAYSIYDLTKPTFEE
ncbi:uncharacterized protein METZ01_LOCUS112753 [marine metagenome]|uniref:Uncharacterized protein n=1 Tax=marine metagenome TaxID=408172 RepID=A0A381X576_9ZZZZ